MEPVSALFPAFYLQRRDFPRNYSTDDDLNLCAFYYALQPLISFDPMTGPIRSAASSSTRAVQPPRPPNAWILYRSDKLKSLPPKDPNGPARAQAEVSRLISDMWKRESEAVRLEYERRAEARKAEHQRLYPNYRFQPMKKEDKEKLRESKKLEKERARAQTKRGRSRPAPYATGPIVGGAVAMPLPVPNPQYMSPYGPEVRFGPGGPSPPLSAASSPNDTTSSSDSQVGQEAQSLPQSVAPSAHASPSTDLLALPQGNFPPHQSMLMMPQSYSTMPQAPSSHPNATLPTPVDQQPVAGPSHWQQPQQYAQPQPSGVPVGTLTPEWSNPSLSQPTLDSQNPEDFVNFDIPFQGQSFDEWQQGLEADGLSFTDSMQALLDMTDESGVFSLSNFSPSDLLAHPSGELTLAMGSQLTTPFDDSLFADFDLSAAFLAGSSTSQNTDIAPPEDPVPTAEEIAALITCGQPDASAYTSSNQRHASTFSRGIMAFVDYEAGEGAGQDVAPQVRPHVAQQSHPMPILEQMSTNTQTPSNGQYVPPAGAMYSSTRRVAASWKASYAMQDSPVEQHEAQPWNGSSS
ncbi:hypothetical protein BV22DRAFT_1128094 [Leucogyrophana mollusca]|uniref:Uncharacterized protein n=1 Tax=Leucogyrophana mollusca TaxID=85980 RepID=A0ACB8BNQ4_9AGAM|nr:hypothetical protein BV22DRAFT_1128094 [Leucogyrophana mollusca]